MKHFKSSNIVELASYKDLLYSRSLKADDTERYRVYDNTVARSLQCHRQLKSIEIMNKLTLTFKLTFYHMLKIAKGCESKKLTIRILNEGHLITNYFCNFANSVRKHLNMFLSQLQKFIFSVKDIE